MRSALVVAVLLAHSVASHAQQAPASPANPEAPAQPAPAGPKSGKPMQLAEDPYLTNYKKFEHRDEKTPGRGPMGRKIGFGLAIGRPLALTTKIFFTQTIAFQAEVGMTYSPWFGPEADLDAQVIWHPTNLINRDEFKLTWYVGGGGRVAGWPLVAAGIPPYVPHLASSTRPAFVYFPGGDYVPGSLGMQGVIGLSLLLQKYPVELYVQPIVTLDLFPGLSADLGAQMGARWYFF